MINLRRIRFFLTSASLRSAYLVSQSYLPSTFAHPPSPSLSLAVSDASLLPLYHADDLRTVAPLFLDTAGLGLGFTPTSSAQTGMIRLRRRGLGSSKSKLRKQKSMSDDSSSATSSRSRLQKTLSDASADGLSGPLHSKSLGNASSSEELSGPLQAPRTSSWKKSLSLTKSASDVSSDSSEKARTRLDAVVGKRRRENKDKKLHRMPTDESFQADRLEAAAAREKYEKHIRHH